MLAAPHLVLCQALVLRTCSTRVVSHARVGTFSNVDIFAEFSSWQFSMRGMICSRGMNLQIWKRCPPQPSLKLPLWQEVDPGREPDPLVTQGFTEWKIGI